MLTFLNSPSILFELFPFIFLIAVKFFYIHLNEKNELEILRNHGIDNLKVLSLLSFCTLISGLLILLIFYTFSSNLKNHYLNLKNKFSSENEYLAVVNENGLWIKEEIDGSSNITIEGMAFSDQDILNFISNLNEKSLIDQASLVAMKVDGQENNSNKKGFTILCKLKQS